MIYTLVYNKAQGGYHKKNQGRKYRDTPRIEKTFFPMTLQERM